MVLTQTENFHLALQASEAAPGINDLAGLLAKAMERPWAMKPRRPAQIILRNNPQWEELIPHLTQLKIEVIAQLELPLWDETAADYVRRMRATQRGREVPILTVQPKLNEEFPAVSGWVKSMGRIEIGVEAGQGFVVRAVDHGKGRVVFQDMHVESLDDALIALERGLEGLDP
jgi:hypothetical protein